MSEPLAELRALRAAETDPERQAALDTLIARLEAQQPRDTDALLRIDGSQTGDLAVGDVVGGDKQSIADQRNADVRDDAQVGNVIQGPIGGDVNAPIIQPGASGVGVGTVHQHFYPPAASIPTGAATGAQRMAIFDLRLRREGDALILRAAETGRDAELPPQPFVLPFASDAIAERRGDAAAWVSQARVVTRRRPEELRKARELGQLLFRHLFSGEILAAFRARRARLGQGEQLRLRLHLPPELATLPWELLNDPQAGANGAYLALDPSVSLVRAVERPAQPLPPVAGPLHLQLIVASPNGDEYPPLDVAREIRRIETALRGAVAAGAISIDPPIQGKDTRGQLRNRFRPGRGAPVHLLHVIAHGDLDHAAHEAGVLIFEDADGLPQPTSADFLMRLLRRQAELPRLVLLNACLGALPAGQDPTSSLAGVLLRAGVPAVVAMQFDLADDAAAELARVCYGELAAGASLDEAVGEARSELRESYPNRLDWLVPVLFLGLEDGVLVARSPAGSAAERSPTPPQPTPPPAAPTQPPPQPTSAPVSAGVRQEALIAFFSEDWERAEPLLAQIVAANPQDSESMDRLKRTRLQLRLRQRYTDARDLQQVGAWQAVLGVWHELDAEQPGYPDPDGLRAWAEAQRRRAERYQRALNAAAGNDWATVHDELTALLADFSEDTDARRLLARAERERYGPVTAQIAAGQFEAAIKVLTQRLEARSDDPAALRAAAALIDDATIPAPAAVRVACGELLSRFGDPRPGVCALPPPFVPIAGGTFLIGSSAAEHQAIIEQERKNNLAEEAEDWYKFARNSQPVTVAAFELARYPVTNAQYQLFMDAGGYRHAAPWWDEAARVWLRRDDAKTKGLSEWQIRKYKDRPEFWEDARFGKARPNHPVVGINWYEATAFCAWLTQHLKDGYVYRLPSEAEWEFAARGLARRPYPWGEVLPDAERANFNPTHHGGTTAVGCFLAGATPEGLRDMAGNVWEWTRSEFRDYPYDPGDGRESGVDPAQKRFTLRGGSWHSQPFSLRAAFRDHYYPGNRFSNLGMRLARHLKV
jgi:formylglycine-generating enzyme required for sulfatase activity/CHAT domain-containing protein